MIFPGAALFVTSLIVLAIVYAANSSRLWFMLDLQIYHWGGLAASHSGDPYARQYRGFDLYFTYPPMAAAVFAVIAPLALPMLKWLMTIGSITALVAAIWLTWGALGYRRSAGRAGATLAVAAVALWLEPVQQTLQLGQVNLLLMLVVLTDLCLPDSKRFKGIGVGLAAGFKLTPLIFVAYLLLTRRFRAAAVAVVTFLVTVAASGALLPGAFRRYWLGGLFLNPRVGNTAYVGNQSLRGLAERLLGGGPAGQQAWLISAVIVGAAGLLLAASASRRGHEMLGAATCALTGLLVSPVSWSHHWVWVAPGLVLGCDAAVRMAARPARLRWAGWAGVLAGTALLFAYPLSMNTGIPGGPAVPQGLIWTVTAPAIQGTGAHGIQLLTGNLYVLTGLAGLLLGVAAWSVRGRPFIGALPPRRWAAVDRGDHDRREDHGEYESDQQRVAVVQPNGITGDQPAQKRAGQANQRGPDQADRVPAGHEQPPQPADDQAPDCQPYKQ